MQIASSTPNLIEKQGHLDPLNHKEDQHSKGDHCYPGINLEKNKYCSSEPTERSEIEQLSPYESLADGPDYNDWAKVLVF